MKFSDSFTALYDVKQVLGEGGMGRVLLAEDRALQRLVAIKLLADFDDGPDGMLRQRFVEEARVCAGFKHPNIVRMFSSGFEDGKPYMVFEYIDGGDLARRIEKGPLAVDEALAITDATLGGLEYAHEHKVIHRDVKPANIILRADGGEAMLMDFGIARSSTGRTFKTQANLILGTPLYMAPELIQRDAAGRGVDIYALGCTLYEMLAGRPPYNGKSDVVVLEMHLHGTPEPLRSIRKDIPEDVELLVEKAMHKQVERRFQTAREMSGWIDTIRSGGRVPRARTVPQVAAPGGATTRPDVVSPASRTPRQTGGSRSVPSRGGMSRGTAPAGATRVLSHGDLDTRETGASPSRSRRAMVAAGAIAVAVAGGWAFWRAGSSPSDVRLSFVSRGLEVSWRTMRATRGAVFTKELEGGSNADGTLDKPPLHAPMARVDEESATCEHSVLVPNLRRGDALVVSLPGPSGDSAWARVVLVPPANFARQVPGVPGATATRVVAATGRVASVTLEAHPITGAMIPVQPAVSDLAELTFEVPLAPELLSEASLVRAEQIPGVFVALPVRTMHGHAERLSEALDRVAVTSLINQLVRDKKFDRNGDFDNMLGETPMYDGMPKQVAKRLAPEGYFRDQVLRLLEPSKLMAALDDFRPHAAVWFTAPGVSDEQKLRMYDRLMLLEQLDHLIRGQLDATNQIGFARFYESFVKAVYSLPAPGVPLPAPPTGVTMIARGGQPWISDDYPMWKALAGWTRDYNVYRAMVGGGAVDPEHVRAAFASRREFHVPAVPGAGGPGTAHLRGCLCILGPNYFVDLHVKAPRPFHVRIAQPATQDWRKTMDDAGSQEPVPPYGQVEITFPARLLPEGPFTVEAQYRLLPSARIEALQSLQRGAITRDLSIRVE